MNGRDYLPSDKRAMFSAQRKHISADTVNINCSNFATSILTIGHLNIHARLRATRDIHFASIYARHQQASGPERPERNGSGMCCNLLAKFCQTCVLLLRAIRAECKRNDWYCLCECEHDCEKNIAETATSCRSMKRAKAKRLSEAKCRTEIIVKCVSA